ncbi:MAG: adenine nucleotide alpha hydrolase family protein [Paludibacteraceae bacterium]
MLLTLIHNIHTAGNLLKSAFTLAANLKKESGVLCYTENESEEADLRKMIGQYLSGNGLESAGLIMKTHSAGMLAADCEELEVSFLMIQWPENRNKQLRRYLQYCRNLRIPYVFFKDRFPELNLEKVLVPVGYLMEEYEKAQFASAFGRFCRSEITIFLANDYGSKAAATAEKMKLLFEKFNFSFTQEKAESDSFKIDKEAVKIAEEQNYGIVLVSASRDYGLDDLLLGPKEFHLIKKSSVPLLLVNPRGDLYTLCD